MILDTWFLQVSWCHAPEYEGILRPFAKDLAGGILFKVRSKVRSETARFPGLEQNIFRAMGTKN